MGARLVFPPDEQGLRSATFHVDAGSSVAIIGPSGSGKTTLLTLLGLLEKPQEGHLRVLGRDVSTMRSADVEMVRRSELSFIFQAFHLIAHLTVFENVMLGLHYRDMPHSRRRDLVRQQLVELGLEGHASAFPKTLSGGEQQRVAIARALVRRPRLLLCDEPTGNLDSANGEIVVGALLRSASPKSAVVIITHDEQLAARCSRQIKVRDGKTEGPADA
ncbi:ABC transporter ATP-binding protein [Microbacterium resistens]|uniref:ABC transporter ATP-binding protein n=1 Tax=Microbacterium resistens TaxID=156977 RepID=UPI0037CA7B61